MAWLRLISVALGQPFLTPVGCFCVASLVSGSPHCSGRAAALVDKTRRDGPHTHLSTMLRTFSGRQPHPAAAEAPQPGSDPAAAGAVAPPPLPERNLPPSQDADAAPDGAARVGSPEGAAVAPAAEDRGDGAGPSAEGPLAGSIAAGEAAWETQLAALEAAKAAKRAASAVPLVRADGVIGDEEEDASDDSDADDAELTAAIAEARIAARRLSLSVDGEGAAAEAPPPPPPTRTRSAPVPHKRRLSHEERATPLSHLRHLLGGRSASADRPASPPVPVARASMAAARDGFARRGEKLEGVNRATEGLAEAARQYRENARKREAEARKSRSRWF